MLKCKTCGKVLKKKQKFCSHECYAESLKGGTPWNKGLTYNDDERIKLCADKRKKRISKKCIVCDKEYEVIECRSDSKFCSHECYHEYTKNDTAKNRKISETLKRKYDSGEISVIVSDETKKKISETLKGHVVTEETRKKISENTKKAMFREDVQEKIRGPRLDSRGEKHSRWKGGISNKYGSNWKDYRITQLKFDNHKCQKCGSVDDLTVHHIVPYKISKSNSLENLITFCRSCHGKLEGKNYKVDDISEIWDIFYRFIC